MSELGVRVGWAGGTGLTSIDQVRENARFAVEAGFDAFWVSQIFGVDPMVALAAVASDVESLAEVGSSVVPLYGRHPLVMAAQARTAQSATNGRFTLGLGPSHAVFVEGFFGEPYTQPGTRSVEFVEAIAPLLKGEHTNVDGVELTAHGWLTIDCEPVPMLLAAMGPRMLKLAGRLTTGTLLGTAVGPKTVADHIVPLIAQAAVDAGNPPPRIMPSPMIAVTNDTDSAYQRCLEQNALYRELPAYRAMLDREGVDSSADLLIAGSEDQVTAGLLDYVHAGATDLRIGIASVDEETQDRSRAYLANLLGT